MGYIGVQTQAQAPHTHSHHTPPPHPQPTGPAHHGAPQLNVSGTCVGGNQQIVVPWIGVGVFGRFEIKEIERMVRGVGTF